MAMAKHNQVLKETLSGNLELQIAFGEAPNSPCITSIVLEWGSPAMMPNGPNCRLASIM